MTNRRSFLKGISSAGALSFLGGTGLLSAIANSSANAAEVSGYKALVCLFLHGGQDCYDTILPYDQSSYDSYTQYRSGILDDYAGRSGGSNRVRNRLLPLNPINASDFGTRQFALPDDLAAIKTLFDDGNAAIIGNVGPLIQPTTISEFESRSTPLPKKLFSHNDQQISWKANAPNEKIIGWGGKFADAAIASGANQENSFTAITLSENNLFLSGDNTLQYTISSRGVQRIRGLGQYRSSLLGSGDRSELAKRLLKEHYSNTGMNDTNLLKRDIAAISNRAFALNETYQTALENATALQTEFPDTSMARQLRAIANTINIRSALGVGRQVFFVSMGGFDTHNSQATDLPRRQKQYADAIGAFYNATVEMGMQNNVTLFTASDFGRALLENGNGTDHGWGGHHFVIGGAVNGNRIYGNIPPATIGHELDAGNGRLIPQISVEQYAATLGSWFGLTDTELAAALPNLANFSEKNLGFMTNAST